MDELWMVMDAESIGLHGEAFAVAYVVVDGVGTRILEETIACPASAAAGADSDRAWVAANIPLDALPQNCESPRQVRDRFWDAWLAWKAQGARLVVDCGWPVEANLLSACVRDEPSRTWEGPYPLYELASLVEALQEDPTAACERLADEAPAHLPWNDSRQSARRFIEARQRIRHALSG